MKNIIISVVLFVTVFLNYVVVDSSKILVILEHNARSHVKSFEQYFLTLIKRGHNLTILSHFPIEGAEGQYRQINLGSNVSVRRTITGQKMNNYQTLNIFKKVNNLYYSYLEKKEIKDFLNSNEDFDLIILEAFFSLLFTGVTTKYNAPFIYVCSTSSLFPNFNYNIGNSVNPSYIFWPHSNYGDKMNFFERFLHTVDTLWHVFFLNVVINSSSQKLADTYFNTTLKPLTKIQKNVSLILLNGHFSFSKARPNLPIIVEVGGINWVPSKPLPVDIEKFINESKHGVIYFCMGSLLRGDTFPEEKRDAFLYAFSQISQRVLWKWEGDLLPGKSDNVMIAKWMPQRDILAHPNVKLFISHGGLLGTTEAVYEGVPILGIPIFGDQRTNVRAIESNGAGELLDYNDITKEVVLEKIQRIINDPKYRENAKQLSDRYRDRPMSPLDTAVYWTEYVIRHKGAPHLKTAAVDLSWYQYLLLDVIAFLIFIFISIILISYYVFKIIFKITCNLVFNKKNVSKKTVEKEKKIN